MLRTLCFRLPTERLDDLLGTITAYPLTEEFQSAWDNLPRGPKGRPPATRNLATGLTAVTGQLVKLFGESDLGEDEHSAGERMLLLTTDAALGHRFPHALEAWERHNRAGVGTPMLADLLPEPEKTRPFAKFVTLGTGAGPVAPNWVFRTATWQIMRRLTALPITIDGREPLPLRMDTDGSAVGWRNEDLIVSGRAAAFSMVRIRADLVTKPGIDDLLVCFDAGLSRLSPRGDRAKHVWIERGASNSVVLHIPMRRWRDKESGEYVNGLDPVLAKIHEACEMQPLAFPETMPDWPGTYRPHLPSSRYHTLGSGPGARFMLRLHEHIQRVIPQLVPLEYKIDKEVKLPKRVVHYATGGLPAAAVAPSGYKRITIACLYHTTDARERMLAELAELTGVPVKPKHDGPAVAVHERLDVVARHCPELLAHETLNRAALVSETHQAEDQDNLVLAWVETEYHPAVKLERDAKRHLRRIFGHRRILSQFIATDPVDLPGDATPRTDTERKHAARAGLRDLLRAGGVLDRRLYDAIADPSLAHRLDRPALLVGIHVRRQRTNSPDGPLVVTMVALYVDPGDLESWRVLMYSDKQKAWVRAGEAIADFYAGSIGDARLGRTREKAGRTATEIERRLRNLVSGEFANTSIVIFVDAAQARTVWPGLQNVQFGGSGLPGDTLCAAGDDVAVVRVDTDVKRLGRPVTRVEKANMPRDARQPAAPDRKIYRLVDSPVPSWYFPGRSVTIKSKGGDAGARFTRWTLPPDKRGELRKPWHSYTGKEIIVARSGSWAPAALAALTARLCEQTIAWDDRTLVPVPLHLASRVDLDHPDYRVIDEDD